MSIYSLSSSLINTEVAISLMTDKYKYKTLPWLGLLNKGRELRKFFRSTKAYWHSSVHLNFFRSFNVRKKGMYLLAKQLMNLPKAIILPFSFWTSLIIFGGVMLRIAWIFSGFAYMPLSDTIKSKNLPPCTLKTNFSRFNFIPCLESTSNTWLKSLV